MCPAFFSMQNTAPGLILKPELTFKMVHKSADRAWIIPARRRVDMNVVNWTVCPAGCGSCDQAAKLPAKVGRGKVAWFDKLHALAGLPRKQVPGKGWAAASSCRSRKHMVALIAF
jgi:hypothetical protein